MSKVSRLLKKCLGVTDAQHDKGSVAIPRPIDDVLLQDLIDFTGLNKDYILKHVNRAENCTYSHEFNIRNPLDDSELEWFYVTSEKYLFGNVTHEPWKLIDKVTGERILDYGGGIGTDTFYLRDKGLEIHYFDISIVQREFVKFRIMKHGIDRVHVLEPYYKMRFDPIRCITGNYDGIITRSLFEHVPYYSELARHLASRLNNNGILYEASQFGASDKDPMHLEETVSLVETIQGHGLELVYEDGVHRCWQKTA